MTPSPGLPARPGWRVDEFLARPIGRLAGALALALLAWLLHGSALQAGWRFDDPPLLQFAASHAPWQYFVVRDVMLQQSYAHITPWNALFYDIGLPAFGLAPRGHYAHLLVVLWSVAVATAALLQRWLSPTMALVAAALFLALPPTGAIAQQLMTGHYAYGLLFSVLALHLQVRALGDGTRRTALAAAGCYALACLCKELYVPLVLVALVLPAAPWTARWRAALPWIAVAAAYAAWRLYVVGGLGGYAFVQDGDSGRAPPVLAGVQAVAAGLLQRGLGPGPAAWAAVAMLVAVVAAGLGFGRRPGRVLLGAALLVLFAPIGALFGPGLSAGQARLLLLVGWATVVLVAWQLEGAWRAGWHRTALAAALVLGGLLAVGQRATVAQMVAGQEVAAAQYQFQARGGGVLLVPEGFAQASYLQQMGEAAHHLGGAEAPAPVDDEDAFLALGPDLGPQAAAWQAECGCVAPLGPRYAARAQTLAQALQAGQAEGLKVRLGLAAHGPHRQFRWQVDGPAGQVLLHVQGYSRLALPASGTLAFGLDNTARLHDPVRLRVLVQTPGGALARTPWLELPRDGNAEIRWPAAAP